MTVVLRALVVEDNPADATLIRTAITRAGFITDLASTASEAVAMVESNEYHLIMCDLVLPDIDGLEVLQTLRGIPNGAVAKIIANTAMDDKESINLAIAHGADDVFVKSSHKTHLLESRFRGLASKALRDHGLDSRLEKVETELVALKELINKVVINTAPVKDLSQAWVVVKGFVNLMMLLGKVLDKTKWIWGPLIALALGVKTGIIQLWTLH